MTLDCGRDSLKLASLLFLLIFRKLLLRVKKNFGNVLRGLLLFPEFCRLLHAFSVAPASFKSSAIENHRLQHSGFASISAQEMLRRPFLLNEGYPEHPCCQFLFLRVIPKGAVCAIRSGSRSESRDLSSCVAFATHLQEQESV